MAIYSEETKQHERPLSLPSEEYIPKVMPPVLGTFDLMAIYLAAIFFIGNAALAASGGVVSITYLLIGGVAFFLPCVIATAQLGVMFPHEGSLYNWTSRALGNYWGFFAGVSYWLPNVLSIMAAAVAMVAYIQGLNQNWLVQPWQQGLFILGLIAFTTILGVQRLRTAQNVVNVAIILTLLVTALMGVAGIVWFLQHGSKTPLTNPGDWKANTQNFALFGLIALLYLGVSVPMNMGGEIVKRKAITRHLLWGTLLVLLCYPLCTLVLLVVRGPDLATAPSLPYEVITTIDVVFGRVVGSISAVCVLSFYIVSPLVYNYATARLLLVASVDQRIPAAMGRLNKHRVPANAIIFQSVLAGLFVAVTFFVVPSFTALGTPTNLATLVYNTLLAAVVLLLALSTIFYFVDLVCVYLRDRQRFQEQRIFPWWVLWVSIIVGPITCLVIVADTLQNSWIPQLIPNGQWWYIVGGITLVAVIITAIGSIYASSQAAWEDVNR